MIDNKIAKLKLEQVEKVFIGGYVALENINFEIFEGDKLAVVGELFSGKTTLLNVICGTETLTSGKIFCDGKDITTAKIKERNFGFLDKSLQLFSKKSVAKNVGYPLKIRGVAKLDIAKITDKILLDFGLENLKNTKISKLNEFEKLKVALARLFVLDRKIYFIDNVFDDLNNEELQEISALLNDFCKQKTVVFCFENLKISGHFCVDKHLFLGYNTVIGFANIHNKEIFEKTLLGHKIYHNNNVLCLPAKILDKSLVEINGKTYKFKNKKILQNFDKCVLATTIDKLNFEPTMPEITTEIEYISPNNVAYCNIADEVLTIGLNGKNFELKDKISFSFDIDDFLVYDINSERLIEEVGNYDWNRKST